MSGERKVTLITGGAQGIGKATAHRLISDGWAVMIADINVEAGEEAAEELGALGLTAFTPTDVSDEAQVQRVVEATIARFGGLDLVMNNAYASVFKWVTTMTRGEWDRVAAVNLTSIFLTTKYAAPHLKARRGGIVNIASVYALMSNSWSDAYDTTKGGIVSLSHALAISLGPEIRVNCICPGAIDVGPWQRRANRKPRENIEYRKAQHPVGRMGFGEDIAATVAFLASDDAGFITGQNIVVDGGKTKKAIFL